MSRFLALQFLLSRSSLLPVSAFCDHCACDRGTEACLQLLMSALTCLQLLSVMFLPFPLVMYCGDTRSSGSPRVFLSF
uniref:Secreted protein n=1 Tax=Setaria viridis TaxID=4556 RepID=A0A4U6VLM7_SETVI|nr:hypothetical protein SEVIR_3G401850v2 [Setaria viridis]